ncbi:MAG TPA: carboxypeptidase regulatory-like domain-containing protein [Thermoprotei archaeon]|nr:carboxypeptidase regulatory-like domain-containing protein [Thermoprotei archaeon]
MISVAQKKNVRQLGYVVIAYSLIPEYIEDGRGSIHINASLIDYVYLEYKSINVGSITYMIPPIGFKFWTKAFVVFGPWFKIKNDLKYPINILYIPIFFKEAGKWTSQGLEVEVDEKEIKDYLFVYMVIQLPAYGHISEIITPNGEILSAYKDSKLSWGGVKRALSVLDNEAYIQVKFAEVSETGLYTVKIKWDPLYIKTIDSKNRILSNAEIRLEGLDLIFLTNQSGWGTIKLYRPGPLNITVYYKGKVVQNLQIKTLINHVITVKCKVYDLKVTVKTMLNQGLQDAEVRVIDTATGRIFDTTLTDKNGETIFLQIPCGQYEVRGIYRRISNSIKVDLDNNKDIELKLNIVLIVPFLNLPLTLEETAGITLAFTSLFLASKFIRRKKTEIREEEEEIEY